MKEPDTPTLMKALCRLLALNLMKDKNKGEQIEVLAAAGMSRQEIAGLVGTTPGTVSVYLSVSRKRGKKTDQQQASVRVVDPEAPISGDAS